MLMSHKQETMRFVMISGYKVEHLAAEVLVFYLTMEKNLKYQMALLILPHLQMPREVFQHSMETMGPIILQTTAR